MSATVDDALLKRLTAEVVRATDFADLASRCNGAWPIWIADALCLLASSNGPIGSAAAYMLQSAADRPRSRPVRDMRLPIEHLLDGDWRFTSEVAMRLLNRLCVAAGSSGTILLVGVPTVALAAADRGIDNRIVYAARSGDPVAEAVRRVAPRARYVRLEELESPVANCAAVDPPWYDDIGVPIVQRASAGVPPGGLVLTCGPDLLTRASSAEVIQSVNRYKASFGFETVEFAGRVRYETPLFEVRALAAAGILNVGSQWRTGLLHACHRSSIAPNLCPLPAQREWIEANVRQSRVWIRAGTKNCNASSGAFITVASSVSRTDPLRRHATLWTSGNTVGVGIPVNAVFRALEAIRSKPAELTPSSRLFHDVLRLENCSATELLEFARLLEPAANDYRLQRPDAVGLKSQLLYYAS